MVQRDVGWIQLAEVRDQRRVLARTLMNLGFAIGGEIGDRLRDHQLFHFVSA
jgi:hypothetical protein